MAPEPSPAPGLARRCNRCGGPRPTGRLTLCRRCGKHLMRRVVSVETVAVAGLGPDGGVLDVTEGVN